MAWNTEGVANNPNSGDILADSGALSLGDHTFTILIWNDTGTAELEVAQRNATNNGDINVQRLVVVGTNVVYPLPITTILNQRIVIRMRTNLSGNIQASLLS